MARSKAYLFGGVEIRWPCAPALLAGDKDTPESAVFHFPGGLKDYLADRIEGQETVTKEFFAGRSDKREGHGAVEWAVAWVADEDGFLNSYCNTIPTPDGGTHEAGLRAALVKGLRAFGELVGNKRAAQITADDVLGTAARHAVGVHPRARVPGPDQGPARDPGGRAHRRDRGARRLRPLAGRQPAAGQPPARLGRRPRRGAAYAASKEKEIGRQTATRALAPSRQARRLRAERRAKAPRSSSSRATPPAARPSRRATARPRRSCRLRGKILNVASASSTSSPHNQLLADLIQALGCGTGTQYRDEDLRYEKVIIMTDADVDGAHIASLLITFFYQEMPG